MRASCSAMNTQAQAKLAERFRTFSEEECKTSSPLYARLCEVVATDPELLAIAGECRAGQPVPNLFFGAVHRLLLAEPTDGLGRFYPSIDVNAGSDGQGLGRAFREFVLGRREAVLEIVRTRLVQTNEVNRCCYLYPAFLRMAAEAGRRPLALIEIGTSAGLNLCWDRFAYEYGDGLVHGRTTAELVLRSAWKTATRPPLDRAMPVIASRIGVDLRVIRLEQPEEFLWLRALIWPEHHQRVQRLEAARRELAVVQPALVEGDGVAMLPALIEAAPAEAAVGVFHTHVANQITEEAKRKLLATIDAVGKRRMVFHLHNNIFAHLHLSLRSPERSLDIPLARTDGHARWIEWLENGDGV